MDVWMDCRIKKLHYVMPEVHFLCLLLNRWGFAAGLDIKSQEIEFEFKLMEDYEERVIEFYGYRLELYREIMGSFSDIILPVLVPCDLYELPYSDQFYQKEHMVHYVVLERCHSNGQVTIFDDNPSYHQEIQSAVLGKAYASLQEQEDHLIEKYTRTVKMERGLGEVAAFLKSNVSQDSFRMKELIMQLLNTDMKKTRVVELIQSMVLPSKRFYSLPYFVEELNKQWPYQKAKEHYDILKKYADNWTILTNLARKYTGDNAERMWGRFESRLVALIELEKLSKEAILDCLHTLN